MFDFKAFSKFTEMTNYDRLDSVVFSSRSQLSPATRVQKAKKPIELLDRENVKILVEENIAVILYDGKFAGVGLGVGNESVVDLVPWFKNLLALDSRTPSAVLRETIKAKNKPKNKAKRNVVNKS